MRVFFLLAGQLSRAGARLNGILPHAPASSRPRARGYSLLEVLISMAILLVGLLAILNFFPQALRANSQSAMRAEAALLAQSKAEELRRDYKRGRSIISAIKKLQVPTEPIIFPEDYRLTYQFCGVSLLAPVDTPNDPRDDTDVARIIVRYNAQYRPAREILYELRFAE